MEKVLLAINGVKPSHKVFRYAVELCQRLKAELQVLQVISPGQYGEYLKKVRKGAHWAKHFIEDSMIAATFAEAGEYGTAKDIIVQARKNMNQLLPESERAGVPYHLTIKSGRPSKEIIRYVKEHRDVVLTIYDGAQDENPVRGMSVDRDVPRKIREHMSIPLVVIKS